MNRSETARPQVAIVVLNFNGLEDTVQCLRSLRAVPSTAHAVILVDNASEIDPEPAARRELPGIVVIHNSSNLGYAGGNNRGIERALERDVEYVMVLNNDTIVAPSILQTLIGAFSGDASLGIVGPVINFMDAPERVMTDGVAFNPGPGTEFFPRVVVPVNPSAPPLQRVDIVNGCCLIAKAAVLRAIGTFDERLFIVHEEADLCLRALEAGYGCAVLGETLVWHKGSGSFERSGRQWQRYFDTRNLYYLLKRHAGRVSRSRPFAASVRHYVLYAFYRYDVECESGKAPAARAVVEGFYDALLGRHGPYARRWRPGFWAILAAFVVGRRIARLKRHRREDG
jgi:GT2 family glycosyltransferase